MKKRKQTFLDHHSKERMANTKMEREEVYLLIGLFAVLIFSLLGGMAAMLCMGLAMGLFEAFIVTAPSQQRRRRRKRILRSKKHQHVPDTAISRAQPPDDPQPTDAALSLTDNTEGADHLTVSSTEEDTEDEVSVSR